MGGIASKTFAKGHPKSGKIANFDNIKGNVNAMKKYKTKFLYKIKTKQNEFIYSKYKYFVIIAPLIYRPALPEKHITKQIIVWHRSFTVPRYYTWADYFTNDKFFFYSESITITYIQVI